MDQVCQALCEKFDGKFRHTVGPRDHIHPAILDVIDWAVGDDPVWANNPSLSSYRSRKKAESDRIKKRLLRTEKDQLKSYLKSMSNRARRAKYAST